MEYKIQQFKQLVLENKVLKKLNFKKVPDSEIQLTPKLLKKK